MFFIQKDGIRLILVSAIIYFIINLFENIFYYSIGRHSNKDLQLETPTKKDWTKIIMITIFFALLQGFLTWDFS